MGPRQTLIPPGSDRPISIVVLFGGESEEHSISCLSAATVLAALDRSRYDVRAIGISRAGNWYHVSDTPSDWFRVDSVLPEVEDSGEPLNFEELSADVVFPVLHGPWGEDGTIQGLLETLHLPYVGSGVLASALTMDKCMAKLVLRSHGIGVGPFVAVTRAQWESDSRVVCEQLGRELRLPLFVKPARMGSSIGISKINNLDDLPLAIKEALLHDDKLIVEEGVNNAREIECGVLSGLGGQRPTASVCGEIVVTGEHEFYDFTAKYLDQSAQLLVPADLTAQQASAIKAEAVDAFESVGATGLARVDFFLTDNGAIYVNEINTMPGFTASSMFPMMWEAEGMPISALVDHLVAVALSGVSTG